MRNKEYIILNMEIIKTDIPIVIRTMKLFRLKKSAESYIINILLIISDLMSKCRHISA